MVMTELDHGDMFVEWVKDCDNRQHVHAHVVSVNSEQSAVDPTTVSSMKAFIGSVITLYYRSVYSSHTSIYI